MLSSTSPNPLTYLWRASTQINVNPGTSDATTFTGSPLADADGDSIPALLDYAHGKSDTDPAPRPGAPQFTFNLYGTVNIIFPILPHADDVICTVETTTTLEQRMGPVTGPVAAGAARFFRLSVTLR